MQELLKAGAFELAAMIKKGEVSPREVVETHIARVEEVNPKLNAMVVQRFEAARREADAATEALVGADPDTLPPLHGVPCSIKETFALEHMPQTGGVLYRKNHISAQDATAVARLRAAGAIPLGVTNVPELAMWLESYNPVYGRSNNPYGLDRTPGGSSGGEAAIVGAGGAPFGLGSDIGGSIRMPAMFCGIYGHKPTGGAVPMTGHFPHSDGPVGRYTTAGPLARRAVDLMPLLQILTGPDGEDEWAIELDLEDPNDVEFKDRRVYLCEDLGAQLTVSPDFDQRMALKRAGLVLSNRGAIVEPWSSPLLREAVLIWGSMVAEASEDQAFGLMLGNGQHPNYLMEFLRLLSGSQRHSLPALAFGVAEKILERFEGKHNHMVELGQQLRRQVHELLQGGAILLTPTHPRPAPKHNSPLLRPFDFVYTGIFNTMELPVTAAPMGLGSQRMPLGVQAIAGHGCDHLTIAVATALERENGGWQIPITSLMDNPPGSLR